MYKTLMNRMTLGIALGLFTAPLVAGAVQSNGKLDDPLGGYQRYSEPKLQDWQVTNQRVRDHGGWQNYAMEPYQDDVPQHSDSDAKGSGMNQMHDMGHMHMHGGKP